MIELIFNIIHDIKETIQYLPVSILAGFFSFFLIPYYRRRPCGRRELAAFFGLVVFISLILQIAFFSREPGSRDGIDLILFSTWGDNAVSKAYVVENVLLFIPLGILLPLAVPFCQRGWWSAFFCLFLSCGLEFFQMVTGRGFCQIDDLWTNVLGGMAGFWIYRIFLSKRWEETSKERMNRHPDGFI
ncbi:MAG: VanZ family protein [Lachnospiraceae bacterium]|nr:VanZ family protein [Lachnospiraceae bacterium]